MAFRAWQMVGVTPPTPASHTNVSCVVVMKVCWLWTVAVVVGQQCECTLCSEYKSLKAAKVATSVACAFYHSKSQNACVVVNVECL